MEAREDWPSVLVVGTVRNCAGRLGPAVARIGAALARCRAVHWLLVESDSTDQTVAALARLAGEVENFRYLTLGALAATMPLRTARIAHCRNRCVEEAARHPDYRELELVAVADFDGINSLLDAAAVATCWQRDDWDAVAANQRGPYYDVWALRHPDWSPNDCWAQYRALRELGGVGHERAVWAAVYARMIRIAPQQAWIEVDSAFGGFALYRRAAFLAGRYRGVDAAGQEVCEHVAFHHALREQGHRIFVNPGLINAAITEHTRLLSVRARLLRAPWRALKAARGG